MYQFITRAALAVLVVFTALSTVSSAGATSEPYNPELPRGMAGVDGEITRIYAAVLDRAPDDSGLRYWTDQRRAGVGLDAVVGSFRTSPEFQQRFASMLDAPVEAWVETMYQRVLGRSSDEAGKTYWTDLVESGVASREALIIHFADSVEYRIVTGTGPEGFAHRVEESRRRYRALGDDYRYSVEEPTPFGFGSSTMLVIHDGAVTERSYETWRRENGAVVTDQVWSEAGTLLGSHPVGAPVRTIDEVHVACRGLLDSLDPLTYTLVLSTDDDGRMTLCGGYDPRIADSPGETVSIGDFTVTG